MISKKLSLILVVLLIVFGGSAASAQDNSFSDPNVDYSFSLPDAKWKVTTKPSATSPKAELVYGDRSQGFLQIRKLTVARDAVLSDVVRKDEMSLNILVGIVTTKGESFSGRLSGLIHNYEYLDRARNMSGRIYYLRANETSVYTLRFSGEKGSLRSLRGQTDSIARTFAVSP